MIETERLRLRPFREEDAADVLEYLKEPAVNCFACMKLNSLEEARKAVQQRAEDVEYTFAIVLKDTGKVIGEIAAHPESSDPDSGKVIDLDTFSPCWMLNKNYHGKGYAYEAAKLSSTTCSIRKEPGGSMPTPRTTTCLLSAYAKD